MAIKHHLEVKGSCLEKVVVISSADGGAGDKLGGTHNLDEIFRDYVEKRTKDKGYDIRVDRIADVVAPEMKIESDGRKINLAQGIKFNDIEALIHLLFNTYTVLKKEKYRESEISIDVTGGQIPNSVAGAVFAILVPTRRFQYIDTNDYKVKSFDVYHELDTILPK